MQGVSGSGDIIRVDEQCGLTNQGGGPRFPGEHERAAALTENRLDNQHIRFESKNGVVTLKGDVDNMQQRQQAEKLAANIPNVQQVVNELDVKGAKHHKAPAGR